MRATGRWSRTSLPTRRADKLWARTARRRAWRRHRLTPSHVTSEPGKLLPQSRNQGLMGRAGLFPGEQGAVSNQQKLEISLGKPMLNPCIGSEATSWPALPPCHMRSCPVSLRSAEMEVTKECLWSLTWHIVRPMPVSTLLLQVPAQPPPGMPPCRAACTVSPDVGRPWPQTKVPPT